MISVHSPLLLLPDSGFCTRCCGLGHMDFRLFPVVPCGPGCRSPRLVTTGRVRTRSRVPCQLLPREQSWERDPGVRLGSEEVVRFGAGSCEYLKPAGVCDPAPDLVRAFPLSFCSSGTKE